mmetsp:Transcript_74219/g.86109  ORF Transcript_74219/g.86109 Transcript_74219/m.86109 type:complete len:375 (+) Transcript_74219:69-1193(+)
MLKRIVKSTSIMNSLTKTVSQSFGERKPVNEFITTPFAQRPGTGDKRHVTLIPGVGVGPETTASVKKIFEAAFCPIAWDTIEDFDFNKEESKKALKKNDYILLGVVPQAPNSIYVENTKIYKYLDVFCYMTHARELPNTNTRHKGVDIVILRENTEGEYSGVEHEVYPGVMESIKVVTRANSLRIAEYAFEFAFLSGRKKVTAVHKSNIMKKCDGLFLECTREVAKKYPQIQYNELIIDNTCMQMVKNPWQFDVMVMPNLYGSIVAHIAAGITGGPGITPGVNIGQKYNIFEQGTRHTGLDIAGKNLANPTALILSSIIMLKHMGLPFFASNIEHALNLVYKEGETRTRDLKGTTTTTQFTNEIVKKLEKICKP